MELNVDKECNHQFSTKNGTSDCPETVIELGEINNVDHHLAGGRERRRVYKNSLSPREMDSLTALCNTFWPSIDTTSNYLNMDETTARFYQSSASMMGTPDMLGGMISGKMKHPKLWMMRLTLWLLSTWFGTLILCGWACLTCQFPYFQKFSKLSPKAREEIVLSWTHSYIPQLRMFVRVIKILTLLVFFTQVDEKDENPFWQEIGYSGPDPQFKREKIQSVKTKIQTFKTFLEEEKESEAKVTGNNAEEEHNGPLYTGLVNMTLPRDIVAKNLQKFGFAVSMFPSKYSTGECFPTLSIKCDAVVVGSGSGGGVVAGVLANAGYKVLVLEKGSYCARTNLSLLEGPSMDEMYLSGGLIATNDISALVLAGSTVGGGSTINWSASIRTPQHVINEWSEKYDLELFHSKLYEEAMDVVCKKMGVQSDFQEEGFNNAVLRRGCQELGYPVQNIPRNAPADHYCGWCCLGCKDGRKKGTAETWLVDLVESGNGAILPGCEAVEVIHTQKSGRVRSTAVGVAFEFEFNGVKDLCVVESKVTVLACGALSTPALLLNSGLKNANIGRNLHLHPVAMAWGYFPDNSPDVWPEKEKKSYEGGIMTAMSPVVGNFKQPGYGAVIQTPALHPGMFSVLMPWLSGRDIKKRMSKFSRTAHVFALARDQGSGTVMSPHSVTYQLDKIDEENLQKGLEKVLRILAASGAEEIGTHNCNGRTLNVKQVSYREFDSFVKEESSRALRDLSTPICSAHQMGSCRMGTDPKTSAVNPMGETWEVEGLYVADTSVFPTALGINPMVTVQAITYCTAQSVLESLRRKKTTC